MWLMEDWIRFPHIWEPIRRLLEETAESLHTQLGSFLQPSNTPLDVANFQASNGNAEGSLIIREGSSAEKVVKFVLASWLHCQFPSGVLDMATLLVMLGSETEVPHFLFEFIQSSSTSAILLLDLIPRKDLVQNPAYLKEFYEDTQLDQLRQQLENSPHCQVYVAASLFVRSLVSPTAMLFKLNFSSQAQLQGVVCPVIKQVFSIWLTAFNRRRRELVVDEEEEKARMASRDSQIKTKGLELDLSENLPKLFSQEITTRVLAAYRALN